MNRTVALTYKSPLHEMTQTTPTCLWNDSASIQELTYSIEHGAVGATCNPVIALGVLKKDPELKAKIRALLKRRPTATEGEIAWELVQEISVKGAALLKPIFDREAGKNGRLSIQTDPRLFRNSQAIVEQAAQFASLAPNMIVKIPATRSGIPAIEEATYRGISINATVCFSLPQCVAVAQAVEGKSFEDMPDAVPEEEQVGGPGDDNQASRDQGEREQCLLGGHYLRLITCIYSSPTGKRRGEWHDQSLPLVASAYVPARGGRREAPRGSTLSDAKGSAATQGVPRTHRLSKTPPGIA